MARFMLTTQAFVPAALIALLAGGAQAQFVARSDPAPAARTDAGAAQSKQIVVTTRDGSTSELHMENGEVVRVVLRGERIPLDRVRHNGGTIEVLGADGAVAHVFDLSSIPAPPAPPGVSAFGVVTPTAPNPPTTPAVKIVRIAPDAASPGADAAPPPVMLGINLSEPGQALRAHLGIGDAPAILIERVIEGLPASEAGLERHDVVVSINGSDGASDESLRAALAKAEPGDTMGLTVQRAGRTKTITVRLAAYDQDKLGGPRVGQWAPLGEGDAQVWVNPDDQSRIETLRERLGPLQAEAEKALEKALEDVHREMLELRGDRLFVRPAEEMAAQLEALQSELRERRPEVEQEFEARLESMERRFDDLESRLGDQIERLGAGMERLAELMERTAERIEERADRENP